MLADHIVRSPRMIAYFGVSFVIAIFLVSFWQPFSSSSSLTSHIIPGPTPEPVKDAVITDRVAAIIENRALEPLVPLLLHFASVLGPAWPIFLFTTQETLPTSAPFRRLVDEKRISIVALPSDVDFTQRLDVTGFLTKPWVWEQLAPAEHVLFFQSDSILCSSASQRVDDFLTYDFVGAPIAPQYGEGFNGGLSLRNRTMILDIISNGDWREEYDQAVNKQQQSVEFEDQWFYAKMKQLQEQGKAPAKFPSHDVAMTFAVETIWYDKPLGYHQIARWQSDKLDQVETWCPEYRLATSKVIG